MGRRGRRGKPPKPREATVAELDREGRGIVPPAEGTPKAVHVEGALAGEQITFERRGGRKGVAIGVATEVHTESPLRVEPRCSVYGACGGCSLQHLHPDAQVEHKQAVLRQDLSDAGVRPGRWLEPLRGPQWNYRRRARLGVRNVPKKGRVLVGFREKHSRGFVMDMHHCDVMSEPGPALIDPIGELVGTLSIASSVPQVEVSIGDESTALVFRVLDPPTPGDLDAMRAFGQSHQVRMFVQPGGLDTVAPIDDGPTELTYVLPAYDLTLAFRPTDFLQVNGVLNREMIDLAISLLEPGPEDRVLDLFCGLGNFSLPLARRCASVVGVEGDDALVQRAQDNARRNHITNATFERGDLYVEGEDAGWADRPFDLVLLDPPRTGAELVVEKLSRVGARRIVYVACAPNTLARDVATLVRDHGMSLAAAGVLDMFPHTAHVESIAVLDRV